MTSSGRRNDAVVMRLGGVPVALEPGRWPKAGAPRVVGVHLGVSDRAILSDDITSGHRQGPTVLAVELRTVFRAERLLNLTQIVRQSPAHAELSGDLPAMVAEDREPKSVLPLRFAAIGTVCCEIATSAALRDLISDRASSSALRSKLQNGHQAPPETSPRAALLRAAPWKEQVAVSIQEGDPWGDVPNLQRAIRAPDAISSPTERCRASTAAGGARRVSNSNLSASSLPCSGRPDCAIFGPVFPGRRIELLLLGSATSLAWYPNELF